MKLSEVYRRAAKRVEADLGCSEYSCLAIREVYEKETGIYDDQPQAEKPYMDWMGAKDSTKMQCLFELRRGDGLSPRDLRVLALCFMAAIMESEGK